MAKFIVPQGMVPGPAGYKYQQSAPGMCDVGPNSSELWPGAWVEVVVQPVEPDNVRPDASGRLLHPLWTFARPTVGLGRRRQTYPSYQPEGFGPQDEIMVESDPGWFWIGTNVKLGFVGGSGGDQYFGSITYHTPRSIARNDERIVDVYEGPFEFTLSSVFAVPGNGGFIDLPDPPPYHTHFVNVGGMNCQLVNAAGTIPIGGGTRTSTDNQTRWALNLGRYQFQGGIVQTVGAV